MKGYPQIILGGDKFLDYWGPQSVAELATVDGVHAVMDGAYNLGVREYDVSLNDHVIAAFGQLRRSHGDAVAIGNPNWRCGIKLGDTDIYNLSPRIRKTILLKYLTPKQRKEVEAMPEARRNRWFSTTDDAQVLSEEEIQQIRLDEPVYHAKLERLEDTADYVLVGTDYADWLISFGRQDVIGRMAELVVSHGFKPLSVSHWAGITLPVLDGMPFEGHWISLNRGEQLLSSETAHAAIARANHPITAFRVLGGGVFANDLEGAFAYLKRTGVASVVIGAENCDQLKISIPALKAAYDIR